MSPQEYLQRRNAYAYPTVGLVGTIEKYSHHLFVTMRALENHHRSLLRSANDDEIIFGYLSVIYWGHYSGQDHRHRPERAEGKVRLAYAGADRVREDRTDRMRGVLDLGIASVANTIRAATTHLDKGGFSVALNTLSELPQLQFAFASKICTFLLPEVCGVVDSVIAEKNPQFGFETSGDGYIRSNSANATRYSAYCTFLIAEAQKLNAHPSLKWADLDKALCRWRAVDIERALY